MKLHEQHAALIQRFAKPQRIPTPKAPLAYHLLGLAARVGGLIDAEFDRDSYDHSDRVRAFGAVEVHLTGLATKPSGVPPFDYRHDDLKGKSVKALLRELAIAQGNLVEVAHAHLFDDELALHWQLFTEHLHHFRATFNALYEATGISQEDVLKANIKCIGGVALRELRAAHPELAKCVEELGNEM